MHFLHIYLSGSVTRSDLYANTVDMCLNVRIVTVVYTHVLPADCSHVVRCYRMAVRALVDPEATSAFKGHPKKGPLIC